MARQNESSKRLVPRSFWKWSPLVGLVVLAGALAGWTATSSASSSRDARVSVALVDVGWSDLEATHRQMAAWFEEAVEPNTDGVRFVPPAEFQLSAFGIVGTAPTVEQAVDLANSGADLLVAEAERQRTGAIEATRSALVEQEGLTQALLDDVVLELDAVLEARQVLIDAAGNQGEIDRFTSDFWALDSERGRLNRDLLDVQSSLRAADLVAPSPVVERIGSARPLGDETDDRGPLAAAAGALVGLSIGAVALRWWLMRREQIGGGGDTVAGVRIVGSTAGSLDLVGLASMVRRAKDSGEPTRLIDITSDAGASLLVSSLALDGADVGMVNEEFELVGASAVLVSDRSARSRDVERRIERLLDSAIEIDSVVLLDDEDRRTLTATTLAAATPHAYA